MSAENLKLLAEAFLKSRLHHNNNPANFQIISEQYSFSDRHVFSGKQNFHF